MKLKLCLMGLLCLFFKANAQQNTSIRQLNQGDTIPDITISNVINYKSDSFKFSDFKGKVVVLDFWATWCASCVKSMSESVELERKFNGKLKVILVNAKSTDDTPEKIKVFFAKRKEISSLTSVILDTTLKKMFPHFYLPHYVWVEDNVIKAVDGNFDLNEANLNKILAKEQVAYKKNVRLPYEFDKLLFVNGNGGNNDQFLYRSILTPYVEGLVRNNAYQNNSDYQLTGGTVCNQPVLDILRFCYPEFAKFTRQRTIYRVKNLSDYSPDSTSDDYRRKHWFCYEATFPARSRPDALKFMQQDIRRYFSLKLDSEYRDTTCWVLTRNLKVKPAAVPPNTVIETNIYYKGFKTVFFNNGLTRSLASALENKFKVPVIDETGYEDNITLQLPGNIYDIKKLQQSLEKQGFLLTRGRRKVNYMVVSEPENEK